MALTDTAVRNAKPKDKPYKLGDSRGLFLLVQPSGGKLWRLKYRVEKSEKKLALGTYPEVSLSDARKRRDEARELLAAGKDPSLEKQRDKLRAKTNAENTFSVLAAEYFDKRKRDGHTPWAAATASKNEWMLSLISPMLGRLPIADIEPTDILTAVKRIELRGNLETARRTLQMASGVFRYAIATARLKSDPTRDLRGALLVPRLKHHAAILDPVEFGRLLRAIDGYEGHYTTRLGLQLAPHVFVRPGELRQARWEEIDFDTAIWSIPAHKTKMRREHRVPLSIQALAIFMEARQMSSLFNREQGYVFPSVRSSARPMSDNTLNAALRRMGFTHDEMTTHGFRSSASTLLNESGKWSPDAIERALSHLDGDKTRGSYNRGSYWDERVRMAQWWSDRLDQMRKGAEVMPFPGRAAG